MKRIKIYREKCVGCLTCTSACMVSHSSVDSRSRIVLDAKGKYNPIFCKHCEKPECVYVCQTGAMHIDKELKIAVYDREKCVSCYMCIMACPNGILKTNVVDAFEVMKCDRCKDTEEKIPTCVLRCPMDAIKLEEY